jgi:hypothetical protein
MQCNTIQRDGQNRPAKFYYCEMLNIGWSKFWIGAVSCGAIVMS